MGHADHHDHAGKRAIACAVITVSDTRTTETDAGGNLLRDLLGAAGHEVVASAIVPDEPERIRAAVAESAAEAILLTGGTGISERDRTPEALADLIERELSGFGELFRVLSFEAIGAAAMLSRAFAGVHRGRLVVAMPGSPAAIELAMRRLVLPELNHLVWELARHPRSEP